MTSLPLEREDTAAAPVPRASWGRRALTLGLSAAVFVIAWVTLDRARFAEGLRRLTLLDVSLVVAVSLAHIAGRALRYHRLLLRVGAQGCSAVDALRVFLVGMSFSVVTPGKVGDLVKARLVEPFGVSWEKGLGLVLIERVLDLLTVVLMILGVGVVLPASAGTNWQRAASLCLVASIAGVVAITSPRFRVRLLGIVRRLTLAVARSGKLTERVERLLTGLFGAWDQVFSSALTALGYAAYSAAIWTVEFAKLALVLHLLGADVPLVVALFVYPVSILAGVLSEGLVGLAGVSLLVSLSGVDPTLAAVAFVVDRAASILPPVCLWGVMVLLHGARKQRA